MHAAVGETGMTPFQALSQLFAAFDAGIASDRDLLLEAATWSKAQYVSVAQALKELSEVTAEAGPCFHHPYFDVHATALQPAELARMGDPLTSLCNAASDLAGYIEALASYLGLEQEASLSLCSSLLVLLEIVETIPAHAAEVAATIANQDLRRILKSAKIGIVWADLKAAQSRFLSTQRGSFLLHHCGPDWRPALRSLVDSNAPIDVRQSFLRRFARLPCRVRLRSGSIWPTGLSRLKNASNELKSEDAPMGAILATHWHGKKTDFALLHAVSHALLHLASQPRAPLLERVIEIARRGSAKDYIVELKRLKETFDSTAGAVLPTLKIDVSEVFQVESAERIPLRRLAAKAQVWLSAQDRFDEWRRLRAADARLRDRSTIALANGLATGRVSPESAGGVLDGTFAETVWSNASAVTPALSQFYGPAHDEVAKEFRELEASRRRSTVQVVLQRHADAMPRGNFGSMGTIRGEIARRRGHMPIRTCSRRPGKPSNASSQSF